jgi:glycosyltransferase involved in cell wall biosynthesis
MKEKNKTYLVITPFFPSNRCFVGSYIFDQLNELRKQTDFNIEVVKITSILSSEKDYSFNNFYVRIFKTIDFPFFILPGFFNLINKIRFRAFLKRRNIEKIKFSHAHVSYPSAYLIEDLECKKIVQHHGLDALQLMNGRNAVVRRIQRGFLIRNTIKHLNNIDLNIGVSNLVLQQLRKYKAYIPKKEFVLYNGVDTSKFFKKETVKNNVFTIGCVANFWKIKGQIILIKSVQAILKEGKEVKLRLIGSGPTLRFCMRYVSENNLSENIFFEREMPHEQLNDFYNTIDLFVLPSYYEALGCVYLESWSTNTQFIGVQGQGISELIPNHDTNNLLAIKDSVDSLKQKIILAFNSKGGYAFDARYAINNTISEFLKQPFFYEKS